MKKLFTLLSFFLLLNSARATHNRAGEILYKRIAPFTNTVNGVTVHVYTYSITVIKYTDSGVNVADRCIDTVYFGDGTKGIAPRINGAACTNCGSINGAAVTCGSLIVNNGAYKVKYNVYSVVHTYPGAGNYLVKSSDPNRNQGIHNVPNSANLPFYIESLLIISSITGANSSPILSNPPTEQGIVGSCYFHNPCAYDPDGDSLSYELTPCRTEGGQTVQGYFYPETGGGNFSINPVTGLVTWCTPQLATQYGIAFLIKEWRKNECSGTYSLIGYVLRDMQIITYASPAVTFSSNIVGDTCVPAGAMLLRHIITPSNYQVSLNSSATTLSTSPATLGTTAGNGTIDAVFSWLTNCSQARQKPYNVNLIYTSSGITMQKFYKHFRVTVLPPTPTLYQIQVDTGKTTLTWFPINSCITNLAGYNIYRKIGGNSPVLGSNCGKGVSANSGFSLIGTVSATASSFIDNNIWPIPNGSTAHYIVTAYTNDCLESSAANLQSVSLIVGMNENTTDRNLKIFPNPFSSTVQIDLGSAFSDKTEIGLFSNDGRLIYNTMEKKQKIQIDLHAITSGIYFLSVKNEYGTAYRKIVKD